MLHGMLFISFSCLIFLARTSSIVPNRNGEGKRPYLVPDIRGRAFQSFTIDYDIRCGLLIYDLYYVEIVSFYY